MMQTKQFLAVYILASCILTSCNKVCWHEPNQNERQQIFKECMALIPAGPLETHYNDWSEVVAECEEAAYQQSLIKKCTKS